MKKIILRKMRFNPHEVKPNIGKLQKLGKLIKTQNWSFLMLVQTDLTRVKSHLT